METRLDASSGGLRKRYPRLPEPAITRRNTSLLVIDMQYEDAHLDYGICARLKAQGAEASLQYYAVRLPTIVSNIKQLLTAFREQGSEVIYTRIQSLTRDGRDRSRAHKNLGLHCPPGSQEGEILEELEPLEDEIVLSKTCGSVFNGTIIDYILTNMGIQNLVLVGVVTSGCVESAARDAADRGHMVIVVEDACAAWTEQLHGASIQGMDEIYAKVKSTKEVLQILQKSQP